MKNSILRRGSGQVGFAPILIILAIAMLAGVVGAGYWLYQNQIAKTQNPQLVVQQQGNQQPTSVIDTSAWKAYTNKYLGFSIKYPSSWFVQFEFEKSVTLASVPKEQNTHGFGLPQGGMWFIVAQKKCDAADNDFRYDGPKEPTMWVKIVCNGNFEILLGYWPEDGAKKIDEEEILNQILSTFKFTTTPDKILN